MRKEGFVSIREPLSLSANLTVTNKLIYFVSLSLTKTFQLTIKYIERYIYERGCLKAGESLFEENIFYVVGTSILLMITKVLELS